MSFTNASLVDKCFKILQKNKWTIGFAESCTGGALSSCFASQAGISEVFMGAIVCYSNSIKEKLLNII
jgi:PncC family amidohydrolase